MKFNIKASLLLIFIILTSLNGKSFAEDYNYTAQSGSFSVLDQSYQDYMCNSYSINTETSSTIVLMFTADVDPDDYLVIYSINSNDELVEIKRISGGSATSEASGSVTTTFPNGKAFVCLETSYDGCYSDMGYRGFTIQYTTTSSMAQGQIYNFQGKTIIPGNVGIGTYSPGFALDVSGSTNVSNDLFANGKIGIGTQTPATLLNVVGITDVSPTTHGLFVLGATNTSNIGFDQNEIMARTNGFASTLYVNNEGGNVVFNGTNVVNGNVGIGTSTPTSILSLGGTAARTIQMERNTSSSTAGQGLTISSGGAFVGSSNLAGGDLTLKSGISTGAGSSAMHFLTSTAGLSGSIDKTPSEKMTILGSGNVGIGTTSPISKFDLRDGSFSLTDVDVVHGMTGYCIENNYGILRPISGTAGGLSVYGVSDIDAVGLRLNGTIGSATPAAATPAILFSANKKSGTIVQPLGATDMAFRLDNNNNTNPLMTVFGDGRVGIGTSTPDALLTVKGSIHAKEVKIDLAYPFADFVFKKDYALKTLNEVHSYIKENGHLPEIPSAEEAKINGMNVADMQIKLLMKIEELTLYAIQQQEKSLDQQKRIEALEKELRQVKNK